jgi:hypothetical protein
MKGLVLTIGVVLGLNVSLALPQGTQYDEQAFFGKWIACQKILQPISLAVHGNTKKHKLSLDRLKKSLAEVRTYPSLQPWLVQHVGRRPTVFSIRRFLQSRPHLYHSMEHDVRQFITFMHQPFARDQQLENAERSSVVNDVINKYVALTTLLFPFENEEYVHACRLQLAHNLFRYCFGKTGNKHFTSILRTKRQHTLGRMLFSVMWFELVGEGWKHWSAACLQALKAQHDAGKTITYIAGGSDIYQLIKAGMYNIHVIDPLLPSQDEYLSEGWQVLIMGKKNDHGIGDSVQLHTPDGFVTMRRASYTEHGTFDAMLSTGKTVTLPQSITTWDIVHAHNKRVLGRVTIDRRFCRQADFNADVPLMSFNELYYAFAHRRYHGWGIAYKKLPVDWHVFVKQLGRVDRSVVRNMIASDNEPFYFISLGSCAT